MIFFDTFVAARAGAAEISALIPKFDQINVVVRAEGSMDDPEILGLDPKIRLYAGEAWSLIHDRRIEEEWYEPTAT